MSKFETTVLLFGKLDAEASVGPHRSENARILRERVKEAREWHSATASEAKEAKRQYEAAVKKTEKRKPGKLVLGSRKKAEEKYRAAVDRQNVQFAAYSKAKDVEGKAAEAVGETKRQFDKANVAAQASENARVQIISMLASLDAMPGDNDMDSTIRHQVEHDHAQKRALQLRGKALAGGHSAIVEGISLLEAACNTLQGARVAGMVSIMTRPRVDRRRRGPVGRVANISKHARVMQARNLVDQARAEFDRASRLLPAEFPNARALVRIPHGAQMFNIVFSGVVTDIVMQQQIKRGIMQARASIHEVNAIRVQVQAASKASDAQIDSLSRRIDGQLRELSAIRESRFRAILATMQAPVAHINHAASFLNRRNSATAA